MVALLYTTTAIASAIAFQDSSNPKTFFYVPTTANGVLGETLEELKITYWGYGKPFLRQKEGKVASVIGLVVAGSVMLDLSVQQQQQLIEQIRKQFGIQTPKLKPLTLYQVVAEPRIGQTSFPFGSLTDSNFPETIEIGTAFNFLVGTGNRSFAQFARFQSHDFQPGSQPTFSIILTGRAEFQTNPWEVTVEADLSQVWSYLRKRSSVEISAAWFELKTDDYDKLIRDLLRDRVIKLSVTAGTVDVENSQWQRFEIGRHLLEALNQQPNFPSNFVRVQPNPRGSALVWENWKILVNLVYGEKAIAPSVHQSTVSVSKQIFYPVSIRFNLNVKCDAHNAQTQQYFQDLGNPSEPCLTTQKIEELRKRLKEETSKQSQTARSLYTRLITGQITLEQYNQVMRAEAH